MSCPFCGHETGHVAGCKLDGAKGYELAELACELKRELEELQLVQSNSVDPGQFQQDIVNRDKVIAELRAELEDYRQTVGAIHVLVDLHTHKHPAPPQRSVDDVMSQYSPLLEASDGARDWFVENWPKIVKLVKRIDSAGLTDEFKDISLVDPGGKLIELDKALNVARGHVVQVKGP